MQWMPFVEIKYKILAFGFVNEKQEENFIPHCGILYC